MIAPASVRVLLEGAAVTATDCAFVGTVAEVGSAATEWSERRVIVPALTSCGECDFCRRGAPLGCAAAVRHRAEGAVPRTLECSARFLARADGPLAVAGPVAAVLGGDGLRAYGAFCAVGVAPAEPVVVIGEGTASALVRQIATAKSAALTELSGAPPTKPWRAFALEANSESVAPLLAALPAGSGVAISTREPRLAIDLAPLSARGIGVALVDAGHPDLLPELVALAARRELDLESTVESIALSDANSAAIARITARGMTALVVIE